MGDHDMEEVPYDDVPASSLPIELGDHFRPVRLTLTAINEASRVLPEDVYKSKNMGICRWLELAAESVFAKLPASTMEGKAGILKMVFDWDGDGPVLRSVKL